MRTVDRAFCRKAAAECVELARATSDPLKKDILLKRSQEWLKLAYSEHEEKFDELLMQFNREQMGFHDDAGSRVRQQKVQQQQARRRDR